MTCGKWHLTRYVCLICRQGVKGTIHPAKKEIEMYILGNLKESGRARSFEPSILEKKVIYFKVNAYFLWKKIILVNISIFLFLVRSAGFWVGLVGLMGLCG